MIVWAGNVAAHLFLHEQLRRLINQLLGLFASSNNFKNCWYVSLSLVVAYMPR